MRATISELEFQVALMMGYYSYFAQSGYFHFYLPSQHEENRQYAADWFFRANEGVCLYFQFKKSINPTEEIKNNRFNLITKDTVESRTKYHLKNKELFSIKLYNKNNYHQHNLLYSKNYHEIDTAFLSGSIGCYVAPYFYSHKELLDNLRQWISKDPNIDNFKTLILKSEIDFKKYGYGYFDNVMYIKPHKKIHDSDTHHYCFNKFKDLTFHSKANKINNKAYKFSDLLKQVENMFSEGNTTTLAHSAHLQRDEIEEFLKNNYYKLGLNQDRFCQILGVDTIDDTFMLLDLIKKLEESPYGNFVYVVSELYKELFDIQPCFIYPNLA
jgi:hypothetical protein